MGTRIPTLLTAAALLGIGAAPARAQDTGTDSRWLAFVGCWEPIASAKTQMCVVPVAGTSAVDFVKIEKGEVVAGERIDATGERIPTAHGACTGWQSAEWSSLGDRVYFRSEDSCPSSGARPGTGMIAMTRSGQLLYIQGATLGLATGVRVERYREAPDDVLLPSEVKDALHPDITATMQARAAAAAPLSVEDVVEASRHVEPAIAEAWLVEHGGPFMLDAKRVVALADAGVPSRTIDLLVALSYPDVFAINGVTHQGERRRAERASQTETGVNPIYGPTVYPECSYDYLLYGYSSYYCDNLYGYGYGYGYPYSYGYGGFYPGGPPTIVYVGPGGGSRPHGHVVNGQGYKEGAGDANSEVTRWGEPRTPSYGTSSGSSSGASGGTTSTPSSTPSSTSTSSSGDRTAHRRP